MVVGADQKLYEYLKEKMKNIITPGAIIYIILCTLKLSYFLSLIITGCTRICSGRKIRSVGS